MNVFSFLIYASFFTSSLLVISNEALSINWKPNHIGSFLSSQIARSNIDIENAAYFSKITYEKNKDSPSLALIAIEALTSNGQIEEAIKIINNLENFSGVTLVQYLAAIQYLNLGDYESLKFTLSEISPSGIDSYFLPIIQAWTEAGLKNHSESIKSLNIQANKGVLTPIYDYHAALISDWAGEYDSAKKKYVDVITRSNEANSKLFISAITFFERHQIYELRDFANEKFSKNMPDSSVLLIYNKIKKQFKPTRTFVSNIKEGIGEAFLNASEVLYNEGLATQALIYAQIAFYLNDKSDDAKIILGNIFKSNENYNRAIKYFKKIDEKSFLSIKSKIAIAKCLSEIGKPYEAISMLESSTEKYKDNFNYLKAIAEIYYDIKDFNNSIRYYDKIFSNIKVVEKRHWPLLYANGIALERGKQLEKAEEKFKQALDFSPDHPLVLNYLGYTWLDQGKKIDLAMIMIKKAVEQRPNDGYIVDSLGWAYYQIGDYSNAVENLEKAVELIPGDSIITDHLGDALFHAGRKIEAKFQWQRALEFSPPEDLIIKINNKIKGLKTPKPGVKAPSSKNM